MFLLPGFLKKAYPPWGDMLIIEHKKPLFNVYFVIFTVFTPLTFP